MAANNITAFLKTRLAHLAALQVKAKRARKRLSEAERSALCAEVGIADSKEWSVQYDVLKRRIVITACLNIYHEVRGREHRHGIRQGWTWLHDRSQAELRKELAELG